MKLKEEALRLIWAEGVPAREKRRKEEGGGRCEKRQEKIQGD